MVELAFVRFVACSARKDLGQVLSQVGVERRREFWRIFSEK